MAFMPKVPKVPHPIYTTNLSQEVQEGRGGDAQGKVKKGKETFRTEKKFLKITDATYDKSKIILNEEKLKFPPLKSEIR